MIRGKAARRAIAACVAIAALAAAWVGARATRGPSGGTAIAAGRQRATEPESVGEERAPAAAQAVEARPPLPRALEGTAIDGALAVDARGHVRVSAETKSFFDYFLMATGEAEEAAIRALTERAVRARLGEPAASEAMDVYDRYAAFRHAAATQPGMASATPRERIGVLRALRRAHLGEAHAAAFFAREEALEARIVSGDPPRVPVFDGTQIAALDAEWRSLDPEARRRARTSALGAAAAARLAQMDAEDAEWDRRMAQYRAERDAIARAHPGDVGALEALRARTFTAEERLRVAAIERIEAAR